MTARDRDRPEDRRGRPAAGPPRGERRGPRARSAQAPGDRPRTTDPARTVAFDVLREVAGSDAYANLVLPRLLGDRGISGRDAAFATELAYGALRLRGRYDAIIEVAAGRGVDRIDAPVLDVLRLGAHQVLGMRVPAHAAVSETVALTRARIGAGPAQFVNAVLRRVTERTPDEWLAVVTEGREPDEATAVATSHPVWIVRALRQALVADGRPALELADLLAADNAAPAVTLVARPGLADAAGLAETVAGATRGRWAPTAVTLAGGDPADLPGIRDGRLGVQDEGSQLVALALMAVPVEADGPERWLDLCAGPGGKAALLAAEAARRGATLLANEVQPHRADLVRRALRAVPGGVAEVRVGDGRDLPAEASFHRVLVDAPCTGLGALRRRPEARWRRVPADLARLTGLQRDLLGAAIDATATGGVIGYVTCSPHVAETDLVVRDVLRRRDDVERLDAREAVRTVAGPDLPLGPGPGIQLWPHVHGTDAMYLTLLRRTAGRKENP